MLLLLVRTTGSDVLLLRLNELVRNDSPLRVELRDASFFKDSLVKLLDESLMDSLVRDEGLLLTEPRKW